MKKPQHGFSVIEVLISLGMVVLIVASIGTALAANNRLSQTGNAKDMALAYARESLEIVAQQAENYFGCHCGVNATCTGQQCTRTSDSRTCTMFEGYASCWSEFGVGLNQQIPLHIDAGNQLVSGAETISGQVDFTRTVSIENIRRDANDDIVESGGTIDFGSKKILVSVRWTERGQPKNVELSTILTGWKKF